MLFCHLVAQLQVGVNGVLEAGRDQCPIVRSIKEIGGEWNTIIVRLLLDGPLGFNELLRMFSQMNSKTLSRSLKSLQEADIVKRTVVSTQPFSVRYSLTEKGVGLKPVLTELGQWGEKWVKEADLSTTHP